MKLATKTLLAFTTAALIGASANAATITVVDSYLGTDGTTSGTTRTISSTDLGLSGPSADKLVVAYATRRNDAITSITYNGVAMNLSVGSPASANNDGAAAIFYLDNPTIGGNLVVTAAGEDLAGSRAAIYLLNGTADGAATFSNSYLETTDAAKTLSATVGETDAFVITAIGRNGGFGISDDDFTPSPATVSELESSQGFVGAWNATDAGTYSITTAGNDHVGVIATFEAVPEPGSLALLGLGGLLIGARRRRG